MSEVSVPFWAMSPRRRKSLPKMCFKRAEDRQALDPLRPHSALIAEHRSPQTFSVYDLKNVRYNSRPKRLMKNSSRFFSGRKGNRAARR